MSLEEIQREALSLSAENRAALAEVLLESLQVSPDPTVAQAWAREIERRVVAYEQGDVQTYSAEEVFAEVARRLEA